MLERVVPLREDGGGGVGIALGCSELQRLLVQCTPVPQVADEAVGIDGWHGRDVGAVGNLRGFLMLVDDRLHASLRIAPGT